MDRAALDRINELARKSKTVGLNDVERAEQAKLRQEYREAFRRSLIGTLEHTVIVDEKGNIIRRVADAVNESE